MFFNSKINSSQKGQVLIISAVSLLLLLGFVGMAVDAGYVYHSKARLRAATDAAALHAVNKACLVLPQKMYRTLDDINSAVLASKDVKNIDFSKIVKNIVNKSIKNANTKVEFLSSPWGVKVTSSLEVKSYFSKVFGVKKWNVSLLSLARVSLPAAVGFDSPLETSGMRPFGLVVPAVLPNNIKPNSKIKLSSLSQNYESPAVRLLLPKKSENFRNMVRAAQYGCADTVSVNDQLYSHKQAFKAAWDRLMLTPGRKVTLPVVSMKNSRYNVRGFIRASFSLDASNDWYVHVNSLLKPRPRLDL